MLDLTFAGEHSGALVYGHWMRNEKRVDYLFPRSWGRVVVTCPIGDGHPIVGANPGFTWGFRVLRRTGNTDGIYLEAYWGITALDTPVVVRIGESLYQGYYNPGGKILNTLTGINAIVPDASEISPSVLIGGKVYGVSPAPETPTAIGTENVFLVQTGEYNWPRWVVNNPPKTFPRRLGKWYVERHTITEDYPRDIEGMRR